MYNIPLNHVSINYTDDIKKHSANSAYQMHLWLQNTKTIMINDIIESLYFVFWIYLHNMFSLNNYLGR